MITLSLKDGASTLGTISEDDLKLLVDQFEEESSTDRDYYVDEQTVQMLEDAGASAALCSLLRGALAGREDGIDIVWRRG